MLRRRLVLVVVAGLCAAVGALAFGGASALALNVHVFSGSFGGEGAGNGQLPGPDGVAVNASTHDVYVVDRGNGRVEQFSAAGAYVAQFDGSAAPSGAFSSPTAIAVDNSGNVLDPSAGDVYVLDSGHSVIDKFSAAGTYIGQLTETTGGAAFGELAGVAVDANGVVWVYQASGEIDSFSDALSSEYLAGVSSPFGVSPGLAVDSEDNLYVHRGSGVFAKINSAGEALIGEVGGSATAAAVNQASNEVFVDNAQSVAAFSSTGSFLERFGDENGVAHLSAGSGVAVDPTNGTVYVADSTADVVAVFSAVVVPDVTTGGVSSLHATSATLNGTVNPDGIQLSDCRFEYGSDSSYGQSAPCVPAAGSIPVDSSEHPVSASLTGLTTGGSYHFRLVAVNANGQNVGQDQVLNVGPGLHGEWVVGVGSTWATLRASIDPHGTPASYYFQYGTTSAYGSQIPAAPGASLGAGSGDVEVTQRVSGLQAGTVYHYRVVGLGGEPVEAFPSVDHTFTTQAAGGGSGLIDGRRWEMVSPEDKQGALIEPLGEGGLIQSAEDGGSIVYLAHSPIAANAPDYKIKVQVLAKRGPGGWSSQELAGTPSEVLPASYFDAKGPADYKLFSPDLSVGLLEPHSNMPLPPLPAGSGRTLYLREAAGSYMPLVTTANVLPGATIDREDNSQQINFEGASPDLSHVVFSASEAFTPNSVPSARNLYEWSAGRLAPVNILPDGTPASGLSTYLGGETFPGLDIARHAVSADGSRVVWQWANSLFSNPVSLFLRDMARGETVGLSEVRDGSGEGEPRPVFRAASSDGSRVFFTDPQALTADAISGSAQGGFGGSVYVFEVAPGGGPLSGTLRDLTVDENAGERPEVLGAIPGVSEDGSYVYFVANGALAPGAVHGNCILHDISDTESCNLYMMHFDGAGWSKPKLIAVLSEMDNADVGRQGGLGTVRMSARVSPDGRYLAFMSARSLTGYDNHDALTGAPDEEAYLYDAATGHLSCVSCNPSGARPTGIVAKESPSPLIDEIRTFEAGLGLDGVLPPWTEAARETMLYQSRYLSDNGRTFFDSVSALVPGDVNGKADVYEFEPQGVGGCLPATRDATIVFSETAGGCIGLISSGTSSEESAFVDASARGGATAAGEGGGDVFFVTASGLAAGDTDNAFDLYDAHECAGGSCPALVSAGSSPPCASSEGCRGAVATGAVFGAPGSSTFAGAGNVPPTASTPVAAPKPKARGLSRAQKLARALKACRKKHGKQRAVCVAHARRAFGARTSRARGAAARSGR